jgi:hypothetical protein
MRHKVNKRIFRILTHTGCVDVTEDHSLLNTQAEKISPKECKVGDTLLHSFPYNDSKKLIDIPHNEFINVEGKIKAQELYLLYKSLDYEVLIDHFDHKSNIYTLNITTNYLQDNPNRIKKIWDLGVTEQYVYDLETENHHFQAGIGQLIVHNTDGIHITSLIMNLFHTLWPTLMKDFKFIHSMLTPIVKVKRRNEVISFYTITDFENWRTANTDNWDIKYFKGLGTSTTQEAIEYFRNMKKVTYNYTEDSDKSIDLAFNKSRADDRKEWLSGYDKQNVLDSSDPNVTYENFINKGLIHFSNYDVQRSIPSMIDGLKISQRKILFSCFKRNLTDKEIRVAQLSAYVSEQSAYHHGEVSLQGAIINMAQDYVGSNNINLLKPNGQFGCLDPETDIIMWDSNIKKAKNVKVGDKLIGDDGKVRNVLKITSGVDEMYEVVLKDKSSYKINSQHILTLKFIDNKKILWDNNCWKVKYFDTDELKIKSTSFMTYNKIAEFVNNIKYPEIFDLKLEDVLKLSPTNFYCVKNSSCIDWDYQETAIDPYIYGKLICTKLNYISNIYIFNNKEIRLNVLIGAIDEIGITKNNQIEITLQNKIILSSLQLIANSLGYYTILNNATLVISGNNMEELSSSITINANNYVYEFEINNIGKGKFCGWSVDGNERFLLNDFTITHNSRLHGGKDAAQPRYIHTLLTNIATTIYRKQDSCILNYLDDDGLSIEPEHYIPILPMILINGSIGIGTGFSTSIPSYNPLDITKLIKKMLEGEHVDADKDDLMPWFKNFKGEIKKIGDKIYSIGKFKKLNATKIEVTELPIGYWTFDFKADLEDLLDKHPDFKKYENKSTGDVVHFILTFTNVDKYMKIDTNKFTKFENLFKLVTSRNLNTTNMYLFNEKGTITKYDSPFDIINQFYDVRINYYNKRKEFILNKLQYDADLMANKIRFIKEVISETLYVHKLKKIELENYLTDQEYKLHEKSYDYIIKIPVYNLTIDKVEELEKDIAKILLDISNLNDKTSEMIWMEELIEFETIYTKHLKKI